MSRRSRAATASASAAAAAVSAALLLVSLATPARAQSAWAKGDGEFKASRYAAAESLYTLRAKHGAPGEVQVNRATAGALAGKRPEAEQELAKWTGAADRAGHAARYNLGTLKAGDGAWDESLAQLRAALEADPSDADARWNYELALRKKQEQEHKSQNSPKQKPQPQPQQPSPSQPGSGSPQPPSPGQPPRGAPQPSQQQGTPPPNGSQGMTRGQAEQLLGALEDLARAEQQRNRKVQVMRERRGKDW